MLFFSYSNLKKHEIKSLQRIKETSSNLFLICILWQLVGFQLECKKAATDKAVFKKPRVWLEAVHFFHSACVFLGFERTDQNQDTDEVANCSSKFFSVSLFSWHNIALPSLKKGPRKPVSFNQQGVSAKRLHKDLGTRQGQKFHKKSWPFYAEILGTLFICPLRL